MARRWKLSALTAISGLAIAAADLRVGVVDAVIVLAIFLLLAFLASPLPYPRASADDGRPVIYWRPGCPYCLRMRLLLGPLGARVRWVDIWKDPAAAAVVRSVTGGDETVPTVVIDGEGLVNPHPSVIRQKLKTRI